MECRDFALQFILTITHNPEEKNKAAVVFISTTTGLNWKKNIIKGREVNTIKPIELIFGFTRIAQQKLVCFDTTDQHETIGKNFRKHEALLCVFPSEQSVITVSHYNANDHCKNTTTVNTEQSLKPSPLPIEHNSTKPYPTSNSIC